MVYAYGKWKKMVEDMLPMTTPRQLDYRIMYVFVDASSYATAVEMIARDRDGRWRRLIAKGDLLKSYQRLWVASSKLELLALVKGIELLRIVRKTLEKLPFLEAPKIYMASDSEVNIQRLSNPSIREAIVDPWER